jgi:hypothetical protein
MTKRFDETVELVEELVTRYEEYNDVYDYAYRNTHFDSDTDFMNTLEDNMSDILYDISGYLYDLFIEDNNLDKDDYDSIDEARDTDDIIGYISNDFSDLDLDLPQEWLENIINKYFKGLFKIDKDMLKINC